MALVGITDEVHQHRGSRKFSVALFRLKNGIFRPKTVSAKNELIFLKYGLGAARTEPNRSHLALCRPIPARAPIR